MCLDEIYISLGLETFYDMLFELHQNKTFCKSVVKVSTNVSIEWLDVPMVVSSATTLHTFLSLYVKYVPLFIYIQYVSYKLVRDDNVLMNEQS